MQIKSFQRDKPNCQGAISSVNEVPKRRLWTLPQVSHWFPTRPAIQGKIKWAMKALQVLHSSCFLFKTNWNYSSVLQFSYYCCCLEKASDWLCCDSRAYDQPAVHFKFAIVFLSMGINNKGARLAFTINIVLIIWQLCQMIPLSFHSVKKRKKRLQWEKS